MKFNEVKIRAGELALCEQSTLAAYRSLARDLDACTEEMPGYMRTIRVGILSSFTVTGLGDAMRGRALFHNIFLDYYEPPYNQFSQQLLNSESDLHKAQPDIIYCILDAPELLDETHLEQIIDAAVQHTSAEIVITDFIPSTKVPDVTRLTTALFALAERYERVHIFSLTSFLAGFDLNEVWYTKYVALGDMRIAPHVFPALADQLLAYAVSVSGATRKCLVLDLDNTLWAGVIGEDGVEGIVPDVSLQAHIMALYREGTILALNSKNNDSDAFEALDHHPHMLLRRDHIAAWAINWDSKAKNILTLAQELNIGTDSMVFVDDDLFQQQIVLKELPEVAVLHPRQLATFIGFHKSKVTDEDRRRGVMYVEERKRQEERKVVGNEIDFLRRLDLKIFLGLAAEEHIERISQLTQKTNQYNMTAMRMSEQDVRAYRQDGGHVWIFRVEDVFGDYGIVGVCFAKIDGAALLIDNFLMSCRVIGRGVEGALVAKMIEEAKIQGAERVVGRFISTKKNAIAEAFYRENGFSQDTFLGDTSIWSFHVERPYNYPAHVTIMQL